MAEAAKARAVLMQTERAKGAAMKPLQSSARFDVSLQSKGPFGTILSQNCSFIAMQ